LLITLFFLCKLCVSSSVFIVFFVESVDAGGRGGAQGAVGLVAGGDLARLPPTRRVQSGSPFMREVEVGGGGW
jgi:hypothetical protein